MKEDKYLTKGMKAALIVTFIFLFLFIVFLFLRLSSDVSEWWTLNFTIPVQSVVGHFTSLFAFSFTELFFVVLIATVIALVIKFIVLLAKKRPKMALRKLTIIGLLIVTTISTYTIVSSLPYNRKPLKDIPQYEAEVSQTQFKEIILHYTDDFNECASLLNFNSDGSLVKPYSLEMLNTRLNAEYQKLDKSYYGSYSPTLKEMMTSLLYREFHIVGFSFGPFGEANVNSLDTASSMPFTAAHEMAHQKGVMREEDANLVALYITLSSSDPYLRFSGYMHAYGAIFSLIKFTGNSGDQTEVYSALSPDIIRAYKYEEDYWKAHNLLNHIGNFFNDIYLKLSGTEGTSSYGDSWTSHDTGETDSEGNIIYTFTFSPYQKLFFVFYY